MSSTGSDTSPRLLGRRVLDGLRGPVRILAPVRPLTWIAGAVLAVALVGAIVVRVSAPFAEGEKVTVVHWTNGHLLRDGTDLRLLRAMAEDFNDKNVKTSSGKRIEIEVYYSPSAEGAEDLLSRVNTGRRTEWGRELPDPTMITPSAAHWLSSVNHGAGRTVVDVTNVESHSIARAYIGIVTYREMAECLGWPQQEIGIEDILALRNDPGGWAKYPCAKLEWGQKPLVAYTDPTTSDTGRGVLLTLYAIGAGVEPEALTTTDVHDPSVVRYVTDFQQLVDHYMIGTIPLNTKIYQGPRYGHFFLMPEDNLVHLYEGTEEAIFNGVEEKAPPITQDMVMIYPKEGAIARENCACIVDAAWVSADEKEAAELWRKYLREDEQQRSFMAAGFRPGTDLPVTDPISPRFGLTAQPPAKTIRPEYIDPAVTEEIMSSWEDVKRPALVSFVVDTSGSMKGEKLEDAREGLIAAIGNMAQNNHVGLVTFNTTVTVLAGVAPLAENKFVLAEAAEALEARGDTALFAAVKTAIEIVDSAQGPPGAIRAVVVLTDGQANSGGVCLDDIIDMQTTAERDLREFCGMSGPAVDSQGVLVEPAQLIGVNLRLPTQHEVQVFFIGIGADADLQIGRLLAEATGAEFQGVAEEDLAQILEEFSKYF